MEMGEVMTDALPSNRNIQNSSFSTPQQEAQEDEVELAQTGEIVPVDENSRFYDMRGCKYLYIFNHEVYQSTVHYRYRRPPDRDGTQKDVDDLTVTFKQIGFKVKTYQGYTHDRIISTIKKISNEDHSRTSCVWIAVLTHGKEGSKLCAADKYYKLSELEQLLQEGNLVGKPKVMLLQACRAGHVDSGKSLRLSSGKVVMHPTPADFLVMHATYDDHYAFRNDKGTFLINAVCAALQENSELSYGDFVSIVNQKVASRTTQSTLNPLYDNKKQIPETRITLTKSLVIKGCKNVAGSSTT